MDDILSALNEKQAEAVTTDFQNVLILAGAGTGKTRVITSRIIYLINKMNINPYNILAVTFTNKAANEMKERVVSYSNRKIDLMIKTFHSFGSFILREVPFAAGRNKYFQIHDASDSKKALSDIIKKFEYKESKLDLVYKWVQEYKQKLENINLMSFKDDTYIEIYRRYNEFLVKSNCFDFEDLILEPIKIFGKYPELAYKYQERFKYILVDEYQDTNKTQFELLKALAKDINNVMVVGDEDQSIYKFRGADINIILNFEKDFNKPKIIKLEENYRSTSTILDAANHVIQNNFSRIGKNLYTSKNKGSKIILFKAHDETEEVKIIADIIRENNYDYKETAILYRTNNQSRPFEQYFNKNSIPYILVGSIRFYEREEIKDAISILRWIINPNDRISFARFVNKPPRGIGEKALEYFFNGLDGYKDMMDALANIKKFNSISKKAADSFKSLFEIFCDKDYKIQNEPIAKIINDYFISLGLRNHYEMQDKLEGTDKIGNFTEFLKTIEDRGIGEGAILSLLEEASLTDINEEIDNNRIKLMTIHNAKGLEFDNVFITGVEEGIFPAIKSMESEEELEEERRLFYVAITRAKKNLAISYAEERNIYGRSTWAGPSLFLEELPEELLELNLLNKNVIKSNVYFKEGDVVRHKEYGKGKIININKVNGKHVAKIDFWDYAFLELILEYTKLEKYTD
jgi:DNA helicase-2/ATP-dependent DNA helicase PcrA